MENKNKLQIGNRSTTQLITCLVNKNNKQILVYEMDMSVAKAINGTSLNKLERDIGKKNIIKSLSYLLGRTASFFNVGQNLTPEQISVIAFDITEKYPHETIEDFVMVFKYARQGKVGNGKVFNLDVQVISSWITQYLGIKAEEIEKEHNRQKGEKNGMSTFKWDKNDIKKFKVDERLVNPVKLGQRMKEKLNVEQRPQIILKDRHLYLKEMYYQVRNMSLDQLKSYYVKADVNKTDGTDKINFDADVYKLVEFELDRRNQK